MSESWQRTIRFKLNGRTVQAHISTRDTLVDVLRRDFDLFGARESCAQGLCGCCTVHVNSVAVSGCLYLAAFVDGGEVLTVEGLASQDKLHPIQQAFITKSGFQCGFCTPGFIMMAKELLKRHPKPTQEQVQHYLTGNLCRCACYPDIIKAVLSAAAIIEDEDQSVKLAL